MLSYKEAIEQTVLSWEKLDSEIGLDDLVLAYDKLSAYDYKDAKFYLNWLDGATDTIGLIYDELYSTVSAEIIMKATQIQEERKKEKAKKIEKEIIKAKENLARYSSDELLYMFKELKKRFENN